MRHCVAYLYTSVLILYHLVMAMGEDSVLHIVTVTVRVDWGDIRETDSKEDVQLASWQSSSICCKSMG